MSPSLLPLLLFFLLTFLSRVSPQPPFPNLCGERCGHLQIPFPFYLNSSCGPHIDAFRLSCPNNSTSPYLTLAPPDLRIIDFLPSGILLIDYSPNTSSSSSSSSSSCDRWYSNVNQSSLVFEHDRFYGVTADNILRLYDCEDSSICKTGCEKIGGGVGGCEGNGSYFGCCYPLSDGSVWKLGDGFSVFSEFGCRGFSSWVVPPGEDLVAERGVEIEWAVRREYRDGVICAEGALVVNATAVRGGVRCECGAGLVGDGFAEGVGCLKSCSNDGHTAYGRDCCEGRLCKKKVAVLAGVLVSALFLAATVAICFLLRRPIRGRAEQWDLDPACLPKIIGKACRTRLFTYQELNEATKGFEEDQKLVDVVDGTVHTGVLDDGSLVAVQKVKCYTEQNLGQVLERVQLLSQISHKNITRIIGCCIDSSCTLFLVHEFFSNRTLEELLQQERGNGLNWYRRINIAMEVANALSYLQCEISPPIYLRGLKCSDLFIDINCSVKVACFKFLKSGLGNGSCSYVVSHDLHDVYNFGLILLKIIMGSRHDPPELVLPKIKNRKFDEIVDPYLEFSEQLPVQCEQIERVAGLAVRCLSCNETGGFCMVEVEKELAHIAKENPGSSSRTEAALQETFSNSSLLQMISMSPDSIHVP